MPTKKSSTPQVSSSASKKLVLLFLLLGIAGLIFAIAKWAIIAWVDQTPVTRFTLYQELDKRYGSDLKEQLIVEVLVNSEAKKRGVTVNSDEINAEFKKTEDQVGGSDTLKSLLAQQRINDQDFKKQLKLQLLVRKMFSEGVNVSDDEVNKYIQDNQQSLSSGESKSPVVDDKMKAQITDQLKQQKISQNFRTWLQDQLKSSRVVRV